MSPPPEGVNYTVPKEMCTGQVNVGFPWLLTPTVTRHQPVRKQQSALLLLLLETLPNSAPAQRAEKCAGKWKKHVPLLTDAPETLGQSSPQLFHFADLLRGLGGWHQVAHFFFREFRGGLAAVRSGEGRTGVQAALRGFFSPAAERWQTGNGASAALTPLIN